MQSHGHKLQIKASIVEDALIRNSARQRPGWAAKWAGSRAGSRVRQLRPGRSALVVVERGGERRREASEMMSRCGAVPPACERSAADGRCLKRGRGVTGGWDPWRGEIGRAHV